MTKTQFSTHLKELLIPIGYKVKILLIKEDIKHAEFIVQDKWNYCVGWFEACYESDKILVFNCAITGSCFAFNRVYNIVQEQ